jgi:N-acetylmuramoyl-L-alanine amidase
LTRDDDTYITLAGRIEFARANRASLFVSVHADTLHDPFGVRGATIYTLSDKASDAESARYAEKENKADAIAGVDLTAEPGDVADILVDLTRRETKSFSNRFAKALIDEFQSAATLNKNPHRSAGFMVLTAPDIPSILLELGYLSNRDDLKLLTSDDWRNRTTDAVLAAVDAFFAQRKLDASQAQQPAP